MLHQNRYTPELIVRQKIQFSVPLYQRLFAWGEKQIKGLITDLIEHFSNNNTSDKPYYLGQMTVIMQNNRYALIDGQQRFTAISLFAIAVLQCQKELGISPDENWSDFLSSGNRLNFIGRKEDNEYLKQLIKNEDASVYKNPRMALAVELMREAMLKEAMLKEAMTKEWIKTFGERVYMNLSFFFAELDQSYVKNPASLNKYFEAMNSTGKGLEQHEILKVELMRNQPEQDTLTRIWNIVSKMDQLVISKEDNQCERYETLIYLCRESRFDEVLSLISSSEFQNEEFGSLDIIQPSAKQPNKIGGNDAEKAIISFPKFLLLVLDLTGFYTGEEKEKFYRPENLNALFKKYKPDNIKAFYEEMLYYRLLLDYYCVHIEYTQGIGKHVLTMDDDKSVAETTTCLKQYLAMLNVSTIYHNWLKPYLLSIHESPQMLSANELLIQLKAIDNDIKEHQLPENIDLMTYTELKRRRYLFWRLDYYLFENRNEYFSKSKYSEVNMSAINNYEFRENRSIEHLHPQNESNNEEWINYDLNNFGNLAMISQSFNSEQSNDPVDVKFARIKDQAKYGELQSLKLYLMYLDAGTRPDGWTEKEAENHGKRMYDFIKKTYVSPNQQTYLEGSQQLTLIPSLQ